MRYKHESMLPIGAFKQRGSVGNRSMRLHGGDGYIPDFEESRRMEAEHAARLAAQGYMRAQEDLNRQRAFEAAQAQAAANAAAQAAAAAQAQADQVRNAEAQQAAQQRANELQAVANQQAQELAIRQRQVAAEQAAASAALQNKTEYVSPGNIEEIRQENLVKDTPFGVGMGQAIGKPYELLNADGEPYRRFDAKGNLTEFVDRLTGKWAKASDVKPVGSAFDDIANKFITEYEYGGRKYTPNEGLGGVAKAAFMDPYSKDTGGFLGEGGAAKLATLVAAGFAPFALPYLATTAGLGAVGAGALYGAGTGGVTGLLSGQSPQEILKRAAIGGALGGVGGYLSGGGLGDIAEAFNVADPSALTTTQLDSLASSGLFSDLDAANFMGSTLSDVGAANLMGGQLSDLGLSAQSLGYTTAEDAINAGFMDAQGVTTPLGVERLTQLGAPVASEGSFLDKVKSILPDSSNLLQGGLALGGLAAASALAPKPSTSSGSTGLTAAQLKSIVDGMPSAMQNYLNMAGNANGYSGGTPYSANANLAQLFPGFSLPTAGPFYGAGRFGDYYAPQAASTTPISPTGLV